MKNRGIALFLALACLLLCCGTAMAEEALQYDASRAIVAYLDEKGTSYSIADPTSGNDVILISYTPSEATDLERIVVRIYVSESVATIMLPGIAEPDNSDMLKLYQKLEEINDSISFVRLIYNPESNVIYSSVEVPYVENDDFGHMVERYAYISALVVDEHYDELTAM